MFKKLTVISLLLLILVGCSAKTGNTLPDSSEVVTEVTTETASTEDAVYEPTLDLELSVDEVAKLVCSDNLKEVGSISYACDYPSFAIKSRSESELLNTFLDSDIAINSFMYYIENTYGEFTVTDCWNLSKWCPVIEGTSENKSVKYVFICDPTWLTTNKDSSTNFEITGTLYIGE